MDKKILIKKNYFGKQKINDSSKKQKDLCYG